MTEHPVIVAARRTPIATAGQRLAQLGVSELAAASLAATLADATALLGPRELGDVVLGNCTGPGGNIARVAALAAGFPVETPGITIDRQCGSGLAAILTAAEGIRAGDDRMFLAGGAESASTAPLRVARGTGPYSRAPFAPAGFPDPEMGPAAQDLARLRGIGRERQDAYALRSHRLALAAQTAGDFAAEFVPVAGVETDDGPRPISPATLARFGPAFAADGTVTAGNSCRVSDGAATVALMPAARAAGIPGLALVASSVVGSDPALPGLGPLPAIRRVLASAGVTLDEVAAIELVEAFAGQVLAVTDELGLSSGDEVDPRLSAGGGAIALGHPWGASGAVIVVRLFGRLVRAGAPAGSLGLAAAAIGGGMGIAALFRVVR